MKAVIANDSFKGSSSSMQAGLAAAAGLVGTVEAMIGGTNGMMPSVLRILASGIQAKAKTFLSELLRTV